MCSHPILDLDPPEDVDYAQGLRRGTCADCGVLVRIKDTGIRPEAVQVHRKNLR
jgi:hypothetical protein